MGSQGRSTVREVGGRGEKGWRDFHAHLYASQVPPKSSHKDSDGPLLMELIQAFIMG